MYYFTHVKVTFEILKNYKEIFSILKGQYYENLPPPRDSPRELLIKHQNPLETVSNKKDTCTSISEKEYEKKCCKPKYYFHCEKREGVNTTLFSLKALSMRDNMTIHGIYFTYRKNVSPSGFVYVTEEDEEALLYYNNETGNVRGSMDFNDGSAFAFHKCLGCYVFYQFNRTYLKSKEKNDDAITVQADSLPRQFSGKKENEYSIMFYYTPEFAADNEFKDNPENLPLKELLKEKFEELGKPSIKKTFF